MYIFDVKVDAAGKPHVNLSNITAVGTKHTDNRTGIAVLDADVDWVVTTFSRVSQGAALVPYAPGRYHVALEQANNTSIQHDV